LKREDSITAVILAGGKSSRMGSDKAFLNLGTDTMIGELISRLKKTFTEIIIIAEDVKKYERFGLEVFGDILPDKGPLGGIYTALMRSGTFSNFIFACDAPFVDLDLIRYMIDKAEGADIVVPRHDGVFEPLCAIYSKRCIEPIEKRFVADDLKVTGFFPEVNVDSVDADGRIFTNINTRDDYHAVVESVT